MATILDATIGGELANSYAELADADAYFEDDPHRRELWLQHEPVQRERALRFATRYIDRLRLRGEVLSLGQALHFPTSETVDRQGEAYIPAAIQYAECEWALSLLENPPQSRIDRAALRSQGVEAIGRPGLEERYAKGPALPVVPIPPEAYAFLRPWLGGGVAATRG